MSTTRLLVGLILGVLMLLPPVIGLPIIVLQDGPTASGAALFLGALLVCAAIALLDVHRSSVRGGRLNAFARANDLELTVTLEAPEYQAGPFRTRARTVHRSVRTRRWPIVEVGDSWPMAPVEVQFHGASNIVAPQSIPSADIFLRAVLSGPVREQFSIDHGRIDASLPGRGAGFMTPEIDQALYEFAGPYTLEVTRSELTVLGSETLDLARAEHVTRGFELIEALAARAEDLLVESADPGAVPAAADPVRRGRRPLVTIAAVLAMFIILPLGFAIAMSILDGVDSGGVDLGRAFNMLFIVVTTVVVARLLSWLSRGRPSTRTERKEARPDRG